MSWIEKEKKGIVITTGDGKAYKPESFTATYVRRTEYNIAVFNFPGVSGSKVDRGTPQGKRYMIEIMFQGADCIDVGDSFDKSAANSNAWQISHPFYGGILVQPVSLVQDNGSLNVTRFQCEVIETIGKKTIEAKETAIDAAQQQVTRAYMRLDIGFKNQVPVIAPNGLAKLKDNIDGVYSTVMDKIATIQEDANKYTQAFYEASSVLNVALYDSYTIIQAARDLVTMPARFNDTVRNRINMLGLQLNVLLGNVESIIAIAALETLYPTAGLKALYAHNAGVTIAALCEAAITNVTDDYKYRGDITAITDLLFGFWSSYADGLYRLQSVNGSGVDAYFPDADAITELQQLVFNTITAVNGYTDDALQARYFTCMVDEDLLTLAYRLYPETDADVAAGWIKENNSLSMNDCFLISSGRRVVYYV